MLALAVLGAAAATMTALPPLADARTGIALAVAIACSGLGVPAADSRRSQPRRGPALVLLLAFMTGCGMLTGMTAGPSSR